MNYAALFGSAGGGASAGGWSTVITASRSITFTQAGTVVFSVVGTGGGGAANAGGVGAATGGNSAPWGRKKIHVVAGDVLTFTLGAGGAKAAANSSNGSPGGTTTVTLNGVTIMTVQGEAGGVYVAGAGPANAPVPSATVTGADYWVPGVRAGQASGGTGSSTGGAAVDILSTGKGRSPDSVGSSNSIGGSVGTDLGGIFLSWLALADWGVSIGDVNTATATVGAPGRGADGAVIAGIFAGGSSNNTVQARSMAGIGAGGGAGYGATNGDGGAAYAFLIFTPD
ncbi:MAG: hypothetical protein KGI52_01870 [Burkholderiales bacterium]|nr:hypothetical protein [Burkholderiales bacterium]